METNLVKSKQTKIKDCCTPHRSLPAAQLLHEVRESCGEVVQTANGRFGNSLLSH